LAISLAFEAGNPISAYMQPILGPSLSERLCPPANKKCSKLIGSMTIKCKRMDEALDQMEIASYAEYSGYATGKL
jgi:hypothetical protein